MVKHPFTSIGHNVWHRLEVSTEAKSAAVGFLKNLLAVAALMARRQVEWAGATISGFFLLYRFLIIPANFEIPVSTREAMENFKKKKKKRKKKGRKGVIFFFFVRLCPSPTR